MWLATRFGWFSVVCARKGDGRKGNPPDPHRLMVRARDKAHLERLRERFPSLKQFELLETPNNDYRFRIIVPKWRWRNRIMPGLIGELDYDNFKNEVGRFQGKEGDDYHDALARVWSVMYRYQGLKCGPGIYDKPKQGYPKVAPKKKPRVVDPFKGRTGTAVLVAEHRAVVVINDDTRGDVGVIRFPEEFEEVTVAYAAAIKAKVLPIVAHPAFEWVSWEDAEEIAETAGLPRFEGRPGEL